MTIITEKIAWFKDHLQDKLLSNDYIPIFIQINK